jgi:hypothetical protein
MALSIFFTKKMNFFEFFYNLFALFGNTLACCKNKQENILNMATRWRVAKISRKTTKLSNIVKIKL